MEEGEKREDLENTDGGEEEEGKAERSRGMKREKMRRGDGKEEGGGGRDEGEFEGKKTR